MRRREFIASLSSVVILPPGAMAQISATPVIGYMHAGTTVANRDLIQALEQGLGQSGYVNGQNVKVEYQFAQGQYDKLPAIAAEYVSRQVSLIVAGTPVAARAAKQATTHIPIVFAIGGDPIKDGLVTSLSRPGGNITGSTFFSDLLTAKRLGLLHELVPNASQFAALVNPKNPNAELEIKDAEAAAHTLGVQLIFSNAATEAEIQEALQTFGEKRAHGLIVLSDTFLNAHAGQIADLASRYTLPTCFAFRESAVEGGLMSYGASRTDNMRVAGTYAGRILKGERPGDLPVRQPTKFDFVINMKTAKALGLSVPYSMQLLADEVIE